MKTVRIEIIPSGRRSFIEKALMKSGIVAWVDGLCVCFEVPDDAVTDGDTKQIATETKSEKPFYGISGPL